MCLKKVKYVILAMVVIFTSACGAEAQPPEESSTTMRVTITDAPIVTINEEFKIPYDTLTDYERWYTNKYFNGNTEDEFNTFIDSFRSDKTICLEFPMEVNDDILNELINYDVIHITLYEKTDLTFLSKLPKLKSLYIWEYNGEMPGTEPLEESYIESFDFLKNLNELISFGITSEPNFKLSYLCSNTNLIYLNLYGCVVTDSDDVFSNVQEVDLDGCICSNGIICKTFPNITYLGLDGSWDGTLEPISNLKYLKELYIWHSSYEGLDAIADNLTIEKLTLGIRTNRPDGIDFAGIIQSLPNLKEFTVFQETLTEEEKSRIAETNPECKIFEAMLS